MLQATDALPAPKLNDNNYFAFKIGAAPDEKFIKTMAQVSEYKIERQVALRPVLDFFKGQTDVRYVVSKFVERAKSENLPSDASNLLRRGWRRAREG